MAIIDQKFKPSTTAAPTGRERRGNTRFPFIETIEAIESKSGARIAGRTSDLGIGGCYVDTISPFPLGTEATVRIKRGTDLFEAKGKVVYSQIGMGMGMEFAPLLPRQQRLLQQWIQAISGEAPPPTVVDVIDELETFATEPEKKSVSTGKAEHGYVLNELLITLMRKKILTEEEGKAMLKKLLQ